MFGDFKRCEKEKIIRFKLFEKIKGKKYKNRWNNTKIERGMQDSMSSELENIQFFELKRNFSTPKLFLATLVIDSIHTIYYIPHTIYTQLTLGSSNPNMSRMPIDPSVACRTALLRAAIDLLDLDPAVPTVDAC